MQLSNAQLASAWLGVLAPFWAGLTAVPLYGLGRTVAGEAVARQAISWWPLVPSLALFLGTLNTPYPLLAMTALWWFGLGVNVRSPNGRSWAWLAAAGGMTAVALLFNLSFAPLLLLVGLWAWLEWGGEWQRPFIVGGYFGLGLILVLGLYTLYSGHTLLEIIEISLANHLDLERPYFPWLFLHTWDFVIFVGVPAFGLLMWQLGRRRDQAWRLSIALAITLLIFVLSGTARGETGRVWFFLMPLVLLGAAAVLVDLPHNLRRWLHVSQVIWLLALVVVLRTVGTGLERPPTYADVAYDSVALRPFAATFGDELHLTGFDGRFEAASKSFVVDLGWELRRETAVPYFFSTVLVSPDGAVLPAVDWQPFDFRYPTTCWPVGTAVVDRIALPLGDNPAPGDWWLSLSAFALTEQGTPDSLTVVGPDGHSDVQVGVGPVELTTDNTDEMD